MERAIAVFGFYGLVVLAVALSFILSPYQRVKFDFSSEQIRKLLIKTFFIFCFLALITSILQSSNINLKDYFKAVRDVLSFQFDFPLLTTTLMVDSRPYINSFISIIKEIYSLIEGGLYGLYQLSDGEVNRNSPAFKAALSLVCFSVAIVPVSYVLNLLRLIRDNTSFFSINISRNKSYWNLIRRKTAAYRLETYPEGITRTIENAPTNSLSNQVTLSKMLLLSLVETTKLKLKYFRIILDLRVNKVPHQWIDILSIHFDKFVELHIEVGDQLKGKDLIDELYLDLLTMLSHRVGVTDKSVWARAIQVVSGFIKWFRTLIVEPFVFMRLKWLIQYSWNNSEDMLGQLYKAQILRPTLKRYTEVHKYTKNVTDKNRQPSLVSVQMSDGLIYRGWPVNTYKPHDNDRELTILPFQTWKRQEDGKLLKITDYQKLVWHKAQHNLAFTLSKVLKVYRKRTREEVVRVLKMARNGSSFDEKREIQKTYITDLRPFSSSFDRFTRDFGVWVEDIYSQYIFKSDGVTFEVNELFKYYPESAQRFYKSLKIEDVAVVNPFEPSLQEYFDGAYEKTVN